MAEAAPTDSHLERAAGVEGSAMTDVFKLLGNDTRLAILLALWEAYEPFTDDNAVPFSELQDWVGVRDRGQFNYHLRKLDGHFVESTDDGYELRNAGHKLVQAVVAGTGLQETSFDRTEIDRWCPYCGSATSITYENERLVHSCTSCEGAFASIGDEERGTLSIWPFAPAGLSNRTPEEIFAAGTIYTIGRWATKISGICPECTGAVETWFDVCEEHAEGSDGACPDCGRQYQVQARFVCTVCKNRMWGPPSILIAVHPTVMTWFSDRRLDEIDEFDDFDSIKRILSLVRDHDQELVAKDPPLVRVRFPIDDAELQLTVDEELNVRDVTTSS